MEQDVSVLILSYSIGVFVRCPPPLGQLPPIIDAVVNYFCVYAHVIGTGTLCASIFIFRSSESSQSDVETAAEPNKLGYLSFNRKHLKSVIYLACTLILYARVICNCFCGSVLSAIGSFNNSDSVTLKIKTRTVKAPFPLSVHPFLLACMGFACCGGSTGGASIDNPTTFAVGYGVSVRHYESSNKPHAKQQQQQQPKESTSSTTVAEDEEEYFNVDVWSNDQPLPVDEQGNSKGRRIMFYIHGGGWKGGDSKKVATNMLLLNLAVQGYLVVSCNYRKFCWPNQLDDAYTSFNWVMKNAKRLGGNTSNIVLGGASAGGHIAPLLYIRVMKESLSSSVSAGEDRHQFHQFPHHADYDQSSPLIADLNIDKNIDIKQVKFEVDAVCRPPAVNITAFVLFYPAIDPFDESKACATFSFPIWCLDAKCGQSCFHWFFENIVMRRRKELWSSARPLVQMRELLSTAAKASSHNTTVEWPRTLIAHGALDSLVPIEHSVGFLTFLAQYFSCSSTGTGTGTESDSMTNSNVADSSGIQISTQTLQGVDGDIMHRECDTLVIIDGGHHSFEITNMSELHPLYSGIMDWLQE